MKALAGSDCRYGYGTLCYRFRTAPMGNYQTIAAEFRRWGREVRGEEIRRDQDMPYGGRDEEIGSMIKDASEQILRAINIYITGYQTSLPGRMRQRVAAQSRKVYGNVAMGDRQIHKKLTIKVMYSCTTSTISPMSLGAVQRIFFPKNPRI